MPLPKLLLDPDESAYSVAFGEGMVATPVMAGGARRRLEHLNPVSIVNVQWVLDVAQYQYLTAFRRTTISRGSLPFLMDFELDDACVAEYRCAFVPDSYSLSARRGNAYIVQCQLEVVPAPPDAEFDQSIVDLYEAYGPEGPGIINQLRVLVNIDLPDALG